MKHLTGISLVGLLGLVVGAAPPVFATTLTPGSSVTPGAETGTFTTLASTGPEGFNFGGDSGTFQEYVVNFSGNPNGSGDVSFIYEVTVSGGSIVQMTSSDFTGTGYDVGQTSTFGGSTGTVAASSASLSTGGIFATVFGTDADPTLNGGDSSYFVILNTDSKTYASDLVSLQDGTAGNVGGFGLASPTPEPSSLALLGTGFVAIAAGMRKKLYHS